MDSTINNHASKLIVKSLQANESLEFHVFFQLTGHVGWIEIGIADKKTGDYIFDDRVFYNNPNHREDTLKKLRQWNKRLDKIIASNIKIVA